MLADLALDIERLPRKCKLIILDAVTQLANYTEGPAVVGFISSLRRLCTKGRTIVMVADSCGLDNTKLGRLITRCDAHLRLRTGKMRSKVLRLIEVIKTNNVELDGDNEINFEVEAGTGIKIIPFP